MQRHSTQRTRDMHSVLFDLQDNTLTVANTGTPFSRRGIVSVCHMHLSAKGVDANATPIDPGPAVKGECLINHIAQNAVDKYARNINELVEDGNKEKDTQLGYDGRFFWELLQNADDAATSGRDNDQFIGSKGLGFKSVLEISDEPEIYSGVFNFHFSRKKSEEVLGDVLRKHEQKIRVPAFRIPHAKRPDEFCQELLNNGYATVIRLPLKPGLEKEVFNQLTELISGECLLFCQRLDRIQMRIPEISWAFEIERPMVAAADGVQTVNLSAEMVENNNKQTETQAWKIWSKQQKIENHKRISVAVCLPEENGEIAPCPESQNLHVFFPTNEKIEGARALIHASCEVESNRKHLQGAQPNADAICNALQSTVETAITDIPPATAILAFGGTLKSGGAMTHKLASAIVHAVKNTPFVPVIGGGKAKPENVRLWEGDFGRSLSPQKIEGKNLCASQLASNKEATKTLKALDAKPLTSLERAGLLQFCRNETVEDCIKAWGIAHPLMREAARHAANTPTYQNIRNALLGAPFWLTKSGNARALSGRPLVWKAIEAFPNWLNADFVDERFARHIGDEERQLRSKNNNWSNSLVESGVDPWRKPIDLFNHVLLPHCEGKPPEWWSQHGWDALATAFKWSESGKAKNETLIINSGDDKEKRAKIFHLPVGEKADVWMPAWQCYAGPEWGGLKIIADFFGDGNERGVLSPPEAWKIDAVNNNDQWRDVASWLGCSWEPKIKRQGALHAFEYFEDIINRARERGHLADCAQILSIASKMHSMALAQSPSVNVASRALTQLKNIPWVLCRKSLLCPGQSMFRPDEAYMPGCGLAGLLPEINAKGASLTEWGDTLRQLGAHTEMPNSPAKLHGYMNALSGIHNQNTPELWSRKEEGRGTIGRVAWFLFDRYNGTLPDSVMVPCLKWTKRGEEIYFAPAKDALWADQKYFDDAKVRRAILSQKELNVFFRFLGDGESLGVQKLSEALNFSTECGEHMQETTNRLNQQYQAKRLGLGKAASDASLPERMKFAAYYGIDLLSGKYPDINPSVLFYRHSDEEMRINARNPKRLWEAFAAAVGAAGECPAYRADFELLLRDDWDDFIRRLGEAHNITEEFIDSLQRAHLEMSAPNESESGSESIEGASGDNVAGDTPIHITSPVITQRHPPADGLASDDGELPLPTPTPDIAVIPTGPPMRTTTHRLHRPVRIDIMQDDVPETNKGRRGEEALCAWLRKKYHDAEITDANKDGKIQPGYDILVTRNGVTEYYECKSFVSPVCPTAVKMSATQMEKAEEAGDRYFLCVIYDSRNNPVKMLEPIPNPATLHKEPADWHVNVSGRKADD